MKEKTGDCLCGSQDNLVFSCSGASDLGQVTDIVARRLQIYGLRKMNCLSVIGANIENSIKGMKNKNILMIDGCPVNCGKKILDSAGFSDYDHLLITDLGLKKGKTTITEDVIKVVVNSAIYRLG
jgi:uncharacterized metal-binding protein